MHAQRYTNGVLTAIAALLGLHLVGQTMPSGAPLAPEVSLAKAAQPEQYRRDGAAERTTAAHTDPTEGGLVSAAEQRKVMISELRNISARLASIESRLGDGVNVNVTSMPAGAMANPPANQAASASAGQATSQPEQASATPENP